MINTNNNAKVDPIADAIEFADCVNIDSNINTINKACG